MKQSLKLSDYENSSYGEDEISMVGIVCAVSGFILAGRINKCADMRLAKRKDFSIWNKSKAVIDDLECFFWNNEKAGCMYMLFETSNDTVASMKQWSQYDFVMIIIGRDNADIAKSLTAKLNKSELVTALQILHTGSDKKETNQTRETMIQFDIFGQEVNLSPKPTKKKGKPASKNPLIGEAFMKSLLFDVEEYVSTMLNATENRKKTY